MESQQCLLKIEGVSKSFPGVLALDSLDMHLNCGEILALVGENGAGKSTLIKILSGVYRPDQGRILIDGEEAVFRSPIEAVQAGISVVYQELSLVPNLTVMENVFAGRPPLDRFGLIDTRTMYTRTKEMLDYFQVEFGPRTQVGDLSLGNQQLVEIIKALSTHAKILILRLRQLKERGITIVYVSHHLEEVFEISDRIAVLRDGRYVGDRMTCETSENEIVSMMVGRDMGEMKPLVASQPCGSQLLRVEGLSRKGAFESVSFELNAGEILSFFGLVGAGRTEVAQALVGLDAATDGRVIICGKEVKITNPGAAMRQGLAYLSEDRKNEGLFLDKSIQENFLATNLNRVAPRGWLHWNELRELVTRYVKMLEVRTPGLDQKVNNLSGGNQQKVLLGQWLATEPNILIVDEPTRGIDVGTKQEIHKLLRALADSGKGIMVISSDLPETLRISDRIAVMRKGRLVGFLSHSEADEERVMELAAGVGAGNGAVKNGVNHKEMIEQ